MRINFKNFMVFFNSFRSFNIFIIYFALVVAIIFTWFYLENFSHFFLTSKSRKLNNIVNVQHKLQNQSLNKKHKLSLFNHKLLPSPLFGLESDQYFAKDWQKVADSKNIFYVYSAYYDDRSQDPIIRVIAITKTKSFEKIKCKLWYYRKFNLNIINCNLKIIQENWNLQYSAFFVICPIKNLPIPDAISVIIHNTFKFSNYLTVKNKPNSRIKMPNDSMAVCVKPIHYEYNQVVNLIEFVELNKILGVSHFLLYNHTIGKDVICLLKEYVQSGLITILPWNFEGIISQKEIRTEGLLASLNDCIYRTMYKFKYLALLDFDEFIIPYQHSNLIALSQSLFIGNVSALCFRNAFFYLQWPDDLNFSSHYHKIRLITLAKTKRKKFIHTFEIRSKLIVIPSNILEIGNHKVWDQVEKMHVKFVPPQSALLHHYRICEFGGNDCINTSYVVDRRAYAWKDELVAAVYRTFQNFNLTCKFFNSIQF